MAAFEKAPPTNKSYNPNKLSEVEFLIAECNRAVSIPGNVM
jgi:hypothetical protein